MRWLLVLLILPLAAAQGTDEFTITAETGETVIAWGSTTSINITATLSCDYFLQPPGTTIRVQTTSDAPEAWGASGDELVFEFGPACLDGSNVLTETGKMSFTPTEDAVGLDGRLLTLTATAGTLEATHTRTSQTFIEYVGTHSIATPLEFPIQFDGEELAIPLTIGVDTNSATMVMFQNVNPGGGALDGTGWLDFEASGEQERTMLWTPPQGDWENATIKFQTISHCVTQMLYDCTPTDVQEWQWTVQNSAAPTEKKSPGITWPLAVLALAWVARR